MSCKPGLRRFFSRVGSGISFCVQQAVNMWCNLGRPQSMDKHDDRAALTHMSIVQQTYVNSATEDANASN